MTEIRTPVQPIRIEKACECVIGRMIYDPKAKKVEPLVAQKERVQAIYYHRCNRCAKEAEYNRIYPAIEFDTPVQPN